MSSLADRIKPDPLVNPHGRPEMCPFHPLHQEPCPLCDSSMYEFVWDDIQKKRVKVTRIRWGSMTFMGCEIIEDASLPPNTLKLVSWNEKDEVIEFIINVGGIDADRS